MSVLRRPVALAALALLMTTFGPSGCNGTDDRTGRHNIKGYTYGGR